MIKFISLRAGTGSTLSPLVVLLFIWVLGGLVWVTGGVVLKGSGIDLGLMGLELISVLGGLVLIRSKWIWYWSRFKSWRWWS